MRTPRIRFSRGNGHNIAREPDYSSSPNINRSRSANIPNNNDGYSTNLSTRSADNNRIDPPIDHAILNRNYDSST